MRPKQAPPPLPATFRIREMSYSEMMSDSVWRYMCICQMRFGCGKFGQEEKKEEKDA